MGERFTLDVDSFQRLLAAAWVLQCERDRKTSHETSVAETALLLGCRVNRIPANFPIPACLFEIGTKVRIEAGSCFETHAQRLVPVSSEIESASAADAPVLRPKSPVSVSFQPEVTGALALAPASRENPAQNVIPLLLAELEEESDWEKIERAVGSAACRLFDGLGACRNGLASRLRLKLIIRAQTKHDLARYGAPGFALLVVGTMLIPQISSRVGWLRPVKAAAHITATAIGTGGAGPPLETSHLRVTDAAELTAVDRMSRYEVRSIRRQAEFGDDAAALTLGMAYETGRGVPQNCKEAARWVELAAGDGNAAAQYNLGLRYLNGDGVQEDRAEARKWLEAASRQGYEKSRLILQGMNL